MECKPIFNFRFTDSLTVLFDAICVLVSDEVTGELIYISGVLRLHLNVTLSLEALCKEMDAVNNLTHIYICVIAIS